MSRFSTDPDLPDDIDLPEDIGQEDATPHKGKGNPERLAAIGQAIAKKRAEAIEFRKETGIEDVWTQCEESYLGIDDANRSEFMGAKWMKPTSMDGPVTTNAKTRQAEVKSTAFVRLTSRYVDAGAAKLGEILLPLDDKNFKLSALPDPDLVLQQKDNRQMIDNATGQLAMRPLEDGELAPEPAAAPPGFPGAPIGPPPAAIPHQAQPGQPVPKPTHAPLTVADLANKALNDAADCAERAETRIYNWLVDCRYPTEVRKVIFDSARIGVGVVKGPTPTVETSMALLKGGKTGGGMLEIKQKISPAATWIDPWNIFPDPACGENIHNGDYVFERDFLSPKKLRELKKLDGYLPDMIDKVLDEGPNKSANEGRNPNEPENKKRFEVWYYYGSLTREEMEAAAAIGIESMPTDKEEVYAIVTVVNDTPIKADINPLESGTFPYHAMAWSRRAGHWAGVGVSEQIQMPQRLVNAATRAMLNNAGKSAGAQIIVDSAQIVPADNQWNLTPDKIWYPAPQATIEDVRKAFMAVEFPNVTPQLMSIIEYGMKLAEESCNIPLVTQGINDQKTPDTFGATAIQDNNANTLLRSIGNTFDDSITDPLIRAFYEWLLLDPEVPDDEKKQFRIDAHGSAALVERAIQVQVMQKIGEVVLQPAYGADPRRWFAEMLRSLRLDPRKIQYTEDEMKNILANQSPPVQLAVAQIRAQSAVQAVQAKVQGEMQLTQQEMAHQQAALQSGQSTPHGAAAAARVAEAQIRAASTEKIEEARAAAEYRYAETEQQIAQQNAVAKHQEAMDKRDLLILEYSLKNNLTLMQVKGQLAQTGLQEETKRQLAQADMQLEANQNAHDRQHDMTKHVTTLQAQQAAAAQQPAAE